MKHFFTQILTLLFFASTCYGNPFSREPKNRIQLFVTMATTHSQAKAYKCFEQYCTSLRRIARAEHAIKINEQMFIYKKGNCINRLRIILEERLYISAYGEKSSKVEVYIRNLNNLYEIYEES